MKTKIKTSLSDEKRLNDILLNVLAISITIFISLGAAIFFFAKLESSIQQNEKKLEQVEKNVILLKKDVIELNKLNNTLIDNKMYLYMNYKNDDNFDKLLKITDDNYDLKVKEIMDNKKTTD